MIDLFKKLNPFNKTALITTAFIFVPMIVALVWLSQREPDENAFLGKEIANRELQQIEELLFRYYQKHHVYPKSLEELVKEGALLQVPTDFGGLDYSYYSDGRSFRFQLEKK